MGKEAGGIILAGCLAMFPLATSIGNAETLAGIQEKQQEVIEQQKEGKQRIYELNVQTEQLKVDIESLDKNIMSTKESIEKKTTNIEEQKQELDELQVETETISERIVRRTEILKERLVAYQKNENNNVYLKILLGSEDFFRLFQQIGIVNDMMNVEVELIEQLESDIKVVEDNQSIISKKQVIYEQQVKDLIVLEDLLKNQYAEKEQLLKELESQLQVSIEELHELEREGAFLQEQEAAMKKAAEEAAKAEVRANETEVVDTEARNETVQENNVVITNDLFILPATGPVTSEFGMRTLNGRTRLHAGIDIGKSGSSVPIVAVAEGVVIRAEYSASYGNVVFITHNLNGRVYTTVYAHMENLSVKSGEIVTQGQTLGQMGNTGYSFGAHLHFEIHEGEWNVEKSNAVNPRSLIDFS